jgi:hypothetical protein
VVVVTVPSTFELVVCVVPFVNVRTVAVPVMTPLEVVVAVALVVPGGEIGAVTKFVVVTVPSALTTDTDLSRLILVEAPSTVVLVSTAGKFVIDVPILTVFTAEEVPVLSYSWKGSFKFLGVSKVVTVVLVVSPLPSTNVVLLFKITPVLLSATPVI